MLTTPENPWSWIHKPQPGPGYWQPADRPAWRRYGMIYVPLLLGPIGAASQVQSLGLNVLFSPQVDEREVEGSLTGCTGQVYVYH
jgi:hypothetical protein